MTRLGLILFVASTALIVALTSTPVHAQKAPVTLGVDVLLAEGHPVLAGKRIGLVTNPSGVNKDLVPTADLLAADRRWKLVRLFGPEHGIRGDVAAGEKVGDAVDPVTGIPVTSLYGKTKAPPKEILQTLDVLVFDIQDIGSRTYTYVSTLGECLVACAAAGRPFVVLDRPNPIGGVLFEGAIRDDKWTSFIGWSPMPVSHGMTLGETARWMKSKMSIDVDLHVVAMKGWTRNMQWEDTGLHWVPTSPHIPHALQARLYIATGMIGGITVNVNEGVGYTLPFETIAAEWLDPTAIAAALAKMDIPGVAFRPLAYVPNYGKFAKKPLRGLQLIVTDRTTFRPLRTSLALLTALEKVHPGKTEFENERSLSIHWGNEKIIPMIQAGADVATVEKTFAPGLEAFAAERAKALIYR